MYKVLCTELRTSHKTQSYLHYQTKMIIWEWWRERERYRKERDWWNPVYKPVLRISPLLYVSLSICASLFFLSPPSSFFFACWRLFIYREVWETAPTFFRSSTDRLMGNIHGPLSFFTCSCHPPLFSLLVCFVSRIFFS